MNFEWIDIVLMILITLYVNARVEFLRITVNKLKKDADAFGDMLETETSKGRKTNKQKEIK